MIDQSIPVIHDARDEIEYPSVRVGRWGHRPLLTTRQYADGSESTFRSPSNCGYSVPVTGYTADCRLVYQVDLMQPARYEPETRNTIGGLGAYREMPPTQEQVDEAIAAALAAIQAAGSSQ